MRHAALVFLLANAARPQTPQENAAALQREAIERQRTALQAQDGSLAHQTASIQKQKASAAKQPRVAWPEAVPEPAAASSTSLLCPPLPAGTLDPIVERAAAANGLTPALLRAVVRQESSAMPCAVSPAGAMGLMQLMPATAVQLGVRDPFDPEQNITAGSAFLRQLLDRFQGNLPLALGAYNAGPARVEASGGIPPIPETQAYVSSILGTLR
ncbi:MAG: lytic transglycosylase domain-containing protein [Acidobacteria bacterium]|nr:lytic transglycosylase domain-containing protein [Acidobacteriota bacterium]